MGLYIKDMRCPNSCAVCEWSRSSWMDLGLSCYCQRAKKSGSMDVARKSRMDFCPLTEVPNQHGRLIDADEFLRRAIGTKCFRDDFAIMLTELVGESIDIIPAAKEG